MYLVCSVRSIHTIPITDTAVHIIYTICKLKTFCGSNSGPYPVLRPPEMVSLGSSFLKSLHCSVA